MFSRLHNVVGAGRGAANAARAAAQHGRSSASRSPLAGAAANVNWPPGVNIRPGSMRPSASIVSQAGGSGMTDWSRTQGDLSGGTRTGSSPAPRLALLTNYSLYAGSSDQFNKLKRVIDEYTTNGRTLNMSAIMSGSQGRSSLSQVSFFRQSPGDKKLRIILNERGDIVGRGRLADFNPENYTGAPAALLRESPIPVAEPPVSSGARGRANAYPGNIPPPPRHAPPLPPRGTGGVRPEPGPGNIPPPPRHAPPLPQVAGGARSKTPPPVAPRPRYAAPLPPQGAGGARPKTLPGNIPPPPGYPAPPPPQGAGGGRSKTPPPVAPRPRVAVPWLPQGAGRARPEQGGPNRMPYTPKTSSMAPGDWEGAVITGAGNPIGKQDGETNNPLCGSNLDVNSLEQGKQAATSQSGDTPPPPPPPPPRHAPPPPPSAARRADMAGASGNGDQPAGYNGPFAGGGSETTAL